jgi:hypothetical protein
MLVVRACIYNSKEIFERKTEGRRDIEKARLRCLEDTQLDLRDLNVKRWIISTNNRE